MQNDKRHTYTLISIYVYTPHSAYSFYLFIHSFIHLFIYLFIFYLLLFYLLIFGLLQIDSRSAQIIPISNHLYSQHKPKPTRDSHYASRDFVIKLYLCNTLPHDLWPFATGHCYVTGDSFSSTTPTDMTTTDSESTIVGNTPTSNCTGALTRPLTPDHH